MGGPEYRQLCRVCESELPDSWHIRGIGHAPI
jgi:hypothetical protein